MASAPLRTFFSLPLSSSLLISRRAVAGDPEPRHHLLYGNKPRLGEQIQQNLVPLRFRHERIRLKVNGKDDI
jgi:hypothetical protein